MQSIFLIQLLFRCHEESPLIHPVGWARRVGHQVVANQDYFDRCAMDNLLTTDCTPDMFPEYRQAHMTNLLPGTYLQIIIYIRSDTMKVVLNSNLMMPDFHHNISMRLAQLIFFRFKTEIANRAET